MLRKLAMRFNGVRRNADDFRAGRDVVFPTIAQRTHLLRANRRLVTRIEKQYDDFPPMVRETPLLAVSVRQRKIGRWFVDVHFSIKEARVFIASSTSSSVLKK